MTKVRYLMFLLSALVCVFGLVATTNAADTSGWYCNRTPANPLGTCVQCTAANPQPTGTCWAANEASCTGSAASPLCGPGSAVIIRAKCVSKTCQLCAAGASTTDCPYNSISACNSSTCTTDTPGNGNPGTVATAEFTGICTDGKSIKTAIGCIPFESPSAIASFFITWGIGIGGGITLLLTVYGGYLVISSAGDPKRLQAGRELVTSSLSGLLLIIFSIFVLRLLGVTILGLF